MQFNVLIYSLCLKRVLNQICYLLCLRCASPFNFFLFLCVCEIGGLLVILIKSLAFYLKSGFFFLVSSSCSSPWTGPPYWPHWTDLCWPSYIPKYFYLDQQWDRPWKTVTLTFLLSNFLRSTLLRHNSYIIKCTYFKWETVRWEQKPSIMKKDDMEVHRLKEWREVVGDCCIRGAAV